MSTEKSPKKQVAIVGGGIAGLFSALILDRKGYEVHLFETAKRLGGRIRTVRLDRENRELGKGDWNADNLNFYVEFGPMRLELDKQLLLKALLDFLGITEPPGSGAKPGPHLVSFPSYSSPSSPYDPSYQLAPEEQGRSCIELMRLAFLRILVRVGIDPKDGKKSEFPRKRNELIERIKLAAALGESADPIFAEWIQELSPQDHWDIQTRGFVHTGAINDPGELDLGPDKEGKRVALFELGFWNLLSDFLSHNALVKIKDLGTFYHLLPENPNAAEWLTWWLVGLSASDHLQGIYGGMECIVDQLVDVHLKSVNLQTDSWVTHLERNLENRKLRLHFHPTKQPDEATRVREFDEVILALPRRPLQEICYRSAGALEGETQIQDLLESSFGFPMVKTFVVVKQRWWEEDNMANRFATRIPTRELHYWKGRCKDDRQGLIMVYTDRPASSFWSDYVPSGAQADAHRESLGGAKGASAKPLPDQGRSLLVKKIARYLKQNNDPNLTDKDIVWYGIRDWGRAPFSGANHAWRPDRRYWVAMRRLADLRDLRGGAGIHVCGEAYSDYHGFIEGALRSATYALHQILKKDDAGASLEWLSKALPTLRTVQAQKDYFDSLVTWVTNLDDIDLAKEPIFDPEPERKP